MKSDLIYTRDVKGLTRTWQFEIDGPRWRTLAGLMSGQKVVSGWTLCEAKNVGRSNETTPCEQAIAEANADLAKKLDRDYRLSEQELDAIPPSPMLAQDFAKQKKVVYPLFSQPKLDGIRALLSTSGAFSRQFQRHCNVGHIEAALAGFFNRFPHIVLDGELYNHELRDNFNAISSVVRKQNVKDEDRARARELIQFHIYDAIMPGDYEARQAFLTQQLYPTASIKLVPSNLVQSADEVDAEFARLIEAGYEGQMLRVPGSPYEVAKRSKALLKNKAFLTKEFKLVAIHEGNGNWAGYAKAVEFEMPDGRKLANGENPRAGIKGSQEFCRGLLAHRATYGLPESQVTVRYFTPTPDGIPRFPVAIDFHPEGRKD